MQGRTVEMRTRQANGSKKMNESFRGGSWRCPDAVRRVDRVRLQTELTDDAFEEEKCCGGHRGLRNGGARRLFGRCREESEELETSSDQNCQVEVDGLEFVRARDA